MDGMEELVEVAPNEKNLMKSLIFPIHCEKKNSPSLVQTWCKSVVLSLCHIFRSDLEDPVFLLLVVAVVL